MSRQLKKLSHKYEFLKLELEEVQELGEEYGREWGSLFGKYFVDKNSEFWVNEETGEMRKEKPSDKDEAPARKEQPDKIKKLYKKISTHTHPDKGGNVDDFNAVKDCYQEGDLIGLLKYAGMFGIDYEMEPDDEELVLNTCKKIEKKIEVEKGSMAWAYCTGNKAKKLGVIRVMEAQLGVKIAQEDYPKDLLDN